MCFEFDVVHRVGMKNLASDALSQLERGGTGITKIDDDTPKMMVSLINRLKMNGDEYGSSDSLCICQQFDDDAGMESREPLMVAVLTCAVTLHMAMGKTVALEAFCIHMLQLVSATPQSRLLDSLPP